MGVASRRIRLTPAAASFDGAMLMTTLLLTGVLLRSAELLIDSIADLREQTVAARPALRFY
jgi:hypothetical protein